MPEDNAEDKKYHDKPKIPDDYGNIDPRNEETLVFPPGYKPKFDPDAEGSFMTVSEWEKQADEEAQAKAKQQQSLAERLKRRQQKDMKDFGFGKLDNPN